MKKHNLRISQYLALLLLIPLLTGCLESVKGTSNPSNSSDENILYDLEVNYSKAKLSCSTLPGSINQEELPAKAEWFCSASNFPDSNVTACASIKESNEECLSAPFPYAMPNGDWSYSSLNFSWIADFSFAYNVFGLQEFLTTNFHSNETGIRKMKSKSLDMTPEICFSKSLKFSNCDENFKNTDTLYAQIDSDPKFMSQLDICFQDCLNSNSWISLLNGSKLLNKNWEKLDSGKLRLKISLNSYLKNLGLSKDKYNIYLRSKRGLINVFTARYLYSKLHKLNLSGPIKLTKALPDSKFNDIKYFHPKDRIYFQAKVSDPEASLSINGSPFKSFSELKFHYSNSKGWTGQLFSEDIGAGEHKLEIKTEIDGIIKVHIKTFTINNSNPHADFKNKLIYNWGQNVLAELSNTPTYREKVVCIDERLLDDSLCENPLAWIDFRKINFSKNHSFNLCIGDRSKHDWLDLNIQGCELISYVTSSELDYSNVSDRILPDEYFLLLFNETYGDGSWKITRMDFKWRDILYDVWFIRQKKNINTSFVLFGGGYGGGSGIGINYQYRNLDNIHVMWRNQDGLGLGLKIGSHDNAKKFKQVLRFIKERLQPSENLILAGSSNGGITLQYMALSDPTFMKNLGVDFISRWAAAVPYDFRNTKNPDAYTLLQGQGGGQEKSATYKAQKLFADKKYMQDYLVDGKNIPDDLLAKESAFGPYSPKYYRINTAVYTAESDAFLNIWKTVEEQIVKPNDVGGNVHYYLSGPECNDGHNPASGDCLGPVVGADLETVSSSLESDGSVDLNLLHGVTTGSENYRFR